MPRPLALADRHAAPRPGSGARRWRPALVLLLLALPGLATGTEEPTPLRTFRSFDRAMTGTVWSLAQDDRGLLWMASSWQLVVFDGATFEPAAGGPAAPVPGQVKALVPRRLGGLYAAHSGGVSWWDGWRWHLLGLEGGALALAEGADGTLWVAGRGGELRRYDETRRKWIPIPDGPRIDGLSSSREGEVWAWGDERVYRLDGGAARPLAGGQAVGARVTAFHAGPDRRVWIGTADGSILTATPSDPGWRRMPVRGCAVTLVRDFAVDDRGRLWIGDNGGTLCFGDEASGWTEWGRRQGLKGAGILALLFDREGSLWIGFNGYGVQQWVAPQWSHRDRWRDDEAFPGRVAVTDIAPSGRTGFVAGVMAHGVWHWDGDTLRRYGREQGLDQDVYAVHEPTPGELWVGTRFTLFERRGERFVATLRLPSGFVAGFYRSPAGVDFAGTTDHGVFRRAAGGWIPATEINARLLDPDVRKMVWRTSGELWVGSREGVTIFDGAAVRYLRCADPGMPSTVTDILEVSTGEVWVSGVGGLREVGGRNRLFTERDGMPGSVVSAMAAAPSGDLWLLGAEGVTRLRRGIATRWDGTNGLVDATGVLGSIWIDARGNVYVGTMSALSRFDAGAPEPAPLPLRLVWTAGPGSRPGTGMVRGRAGAWSWRAPTLLPLPVEYRVRVPGILDGWSSPQSEPRLTLPNLPSGRWVIEVQGRRRGAAAWSPPLTSGFLVPRRPWETWWARGGAAVTVLLLMNLVLRLRTRRHRAREAVLDREVAARTSDLEQARTELELANRSLARLARTDGLTGLANRTAFDERLTSEWARARRSGEPLALILGDVDHFKLYNDHYGHQAGDRCLQVLGGLLAGRARRAADLAARYGGEELVLLLPSLDLPAASRMAEAIVAEVAARRLPHESSPVSPHVTMSLGVASASPHELASPADLLALADRALYRAKARGRNRWQACRTEEAGDLPLAGGIAPRGVNSATAYDAASEEAARMVGAA